MELRPGEYEPQLAPAEAALDDLESVDPYLRRSVGMSGVKVRRAVIIEVHRDHDPEEAADRRHEESFSRAAAEQPA
jgi:FMN-dependent NADH-azoreductase